MLDVIAPHRTACGKSIMPDERRIPVIARRESSVTGFQQRREAGDSASFARAGDPEEGEGNDADSSEHDQVPRGAKVHGGDLLV